MDLALIVLAAAVRSPAAPVESGLAPTSTVHYRVVATSADGTTTGADNDLTFELFATSDCSGAAIWSSTVDVTAAGLQTTANTTVAVSGANTYRWRILYAGNSVNLATACFAGRMNAGQLQDTVVAWLERNPAKRRYSRCAAAAFDAQDGQQRLRLGVIAFRRLPQHLWHGRRRHDDERVRRGLRRRGEIGIAGAVPQLLEARIFRDDTLFGQRE